MTAGAPDEVLSRLRAEIDELDRLLLDTVRRRLSVVGRVAEHKREHGIPMMAQHRLDAVHERAARYGEEHGISPGFLHRLFDVLLEETCRLEDDIIAAGGRPGGP
jgi:chorismate mutase-like protein